MGENHSLIILSLIKKKENKIKMKSRIVILFVSLLFCFSYQSNGKNRTDNLSSTLKINSSDTSAVYFNLLHAKQFESFGIKKYDSALLYLNKAEALSDELNYKRWLYDIYFESASLFTSSGNNSLALKYYFKMLELLDIEMSNETKNSKQQNKYSELFLSIGTCYFKMENWDKALEYYLKSLKICNELYISDKSVPMVKKQLMLYNNMGSVCLTRNDLKGAKTNYDKALEINESINNQTFYATIYNNLGIVYKTQKEYQVAFDYYDKALQIRTQLLDTAGLAQVYNNLGDCYYLVNNYSKAIEVLNKAIEFSRLSSSLQSYMKAANFLSLAYEKSGDFRNSLEMHRLYKELYDSVNSAERIQLASKLELQYFFEKQQKENDLRQQIALSKKQRKVLVFMIISGLLLSSFVVLLLFIRNQKIKIKRNELFQEGLVLESKNLNLEKQNLELEKNNLKLELEFKNKELATHVLYLLKKNEFIGSITEKLLAIKPLLSLENRKWIQDIVREMNSNVDNTVWGEFEMRFQQVHGDFYNELNSHFPDLSPNEKKLCAFLRLNMTTKEISSITFQTVKSIQVARTRLRKKMGMTRDENLISFLQSL